MASEDGASIWSVEDDEPLMRKRIATRSPLEFASSSGKGVGEIEAVVEVEPVSRSVSHAEAVAAEASSLSHVATSDFEPFDSPSRSEVQVADASPASLSGALQ